MSSNNLSGFFSDADGSSSGSTTAVTPTPPGASTALPVTPSGDSTHDLYVVSGVVSGENLVLTRSDTTTIVIPLAAVFSAGGITGLTFNETTGTLTINQGGSSYSAHIDVSGAELDNYRTAAAQDVIDAGLQQRVDGIFFVSTTAQRALNPPVGEFGLYSDYNGTPVLEHTQPMVARGIRGVGNGFPIPDSSEGEILYDDWEIVSDSSDAVQFVGQSLTTEQQATARRNIGAQQTIDGVFLVSTAAQRALDPPVGELAFFANVGGVPTRESTQGLLVRGVSGFGDPTYEFNDDDESQLWFEVEFAGGGGGGGTAIFATSDAWESQNGLTLQLDEYVSTDEDYVPVRADAELRAAGYEAGDSFFITERDIEYQVIITGGNFALQYVISNRDTIAELSGGQGVLDDISDNTTNIATNTADIESVVQHNHEQDARIAALENQDFTTTISSFTADSTLSSFFTSGTIINKGNAGSNLYQAWTVTREGHELIGYLQLTDTERDTFRNEFSLTQGVDSNIYIPANPDAPHTIGIKAFPAADFNDLSSSTQVMLGQISSMRFGGNVGSETMFEIRWELLNYSDAIDTGLGTVTSGEIYGAAGDKRYAFLAPTIYTAPAWEFREATVSRTEIISGGADNALRDAPDSVADDTAWLAYINNLGITGGGSTVRVDGVEVDDPNFVDNLISTSTARGVAFGADALGNIIGQVDVTGLSGMGDSALVGTTAGSLVKVNVAQDGFDDAVAGTDYQDPLTAGTDYQTPLTAGTDYQVPITDGSLPISRTANLQTSLDGKEGLIVVQAIPPGTTTNGLKWVDSGTGDTYVYNGGNWIQIAGQGEQVESGSGGGGTTDSRIPSSVTDDNYPRFSGTNGTLEQRTPSQVLSDITTTAQLSTINTDLSGYTPATWNGKQDALTAGTDYLAPPGNASASNTGLLTSTDWSTFNSKQPAGNYLTSISQTVTDYPTGLRNSELSDQLLPEVTGTNNGAIMKVTDGAWALGTDETGSGSGDLTGANDFGNGFSIDSAAGIVTPPTPALARVSETRDDAGSIFPDNSALWSIRRGPSFSGTDGLSVAIGTLSNLVDNYLWTGSEGIADLTFASTLTHVTINTADGDITLMLTDPITSSSDFGWNIASVTSDLTTSTNSAWENVNWDWYTADPATSGTTGPATLSVASGNTDVLDVTSTGVNIAGALTVNGAALSGSDSRIPSSVADDSYARFNGTDGTLEARTAAQVLSDIGAQASGNYQTTIGSTTDLSFRNLTATGTITGISAADVGAEPTITSTLTLDGGVTVTSAGSGSSATLTFAINGRNEMRLTSTGLVVRGEITGNNGTIS